MDPIDLFDLRALFERHRILVCFNGPISRGLIEEIGNALRNYLDAEQTKPGAATDVFSIYIELTQNIRRYAASRGYSDAETAATVVVARHDDGHYMVLAGNLVEQDDGAVLLQRIEELSRLDKAELKAAYKAQLRAPRPSEPGAGAGLGLIEIARRAAQPLRAMLTDVGGGRGFFSLCAIV